MAGSELHAFISYAHAGDRAVGAMLRNSLHAFARPMFGLRRIRVFLDATSLAPGDLPRRLKEALDSAGQLIVLCSPEAAASRWVDQEIRHFLATKGAGRILLVRTAGRLAWSGSDFDPSSDAVPPALRGAFRAEPLWLDIGFARGQPGRDKTPEFRSVVAGLASVLLDRPLDELAGEDVRTQRRLTLLRNAAVAGLALLTLTSLGLAVVSELNRRDALEARDRALERALAITAANASSGDPDFVASREAAALALEAWRRGPSSEAWSAASRMLGKLPQAVVLAGEEIAAAEFRPLHDEFLIATTSGVVSLMDVTGRELWKTDLGAKLNVAAWSPGGETLALAGPDGQAFLLSAEGKVTARRRLGSRIGDREGHEASAIWMLGANQALVAGGEQIALVDFLAGGQSVQKLETDLRRVTRCGETIVWARQDGRVFASDMRLSAPPRLIHTHLQDVSALDCADHGRSVVSSGSEDQIIWTYEGSSRVFPAAGWQAVHLSPSGRVLAIQEVQQGGASFQEHEGENKLTVYMHGQEGAILHHANAYQSDLAVFIGETLFAADEPSAIVRFDSAHAHVSQLYPLQDQIDQMQTTPAGTMLVYASARGSLVALDLSHGERRGLGRLPGWPQTLRISADGRFALAISHIDELGPDGTRRAVAVAATDAAGGTVELAGASGLEKAPDGGYLSVFSGGGNSTLVRTRLDPYRSERVAQIPGWFSSATVDPDSGRIQLAGESGVAMLDRSGKELWRERLGRIKDAKPAFAGGGRIAVLTTAELRPDLREAGTGAPIPPTPRGEDMQIWDISPDGATLAATRTFDAVVVRRLPDQVVGEFAPNNSYSSAYAPDGAWFAGVDAANMLQLFHLHEPTGRSAHPLKRTVNRSLVVSPDGGSLYLLGEDGLSRFDLPASGSPALEHELQSGVQVEAVWPSPDGELAATAASDQTGRLIEARTGKVIAATRFPSSVIAAAFDLEGGRMAFADSGGSVRVFETKTGRLWADIRTGLRFVADIGFIEGGGWMWVKGSPGLTLYRMDPLEELCRRAGANLSSDAWMAAGGLGAPPASCPGWASR